MEKPVPYFLASLGLLLAFLAISFNLIKIHQGPPQKVLGASANLEAEESFWENFLSNHPNYEPGQKRLGQIKTPAP